MNGQEGRCGAHRPNRACRDIRPVGTPEAHRFTGTASMIAGAGVPLPTVAAAVAVVIELGGGLAIFAG